VTCLDTSWGPTSSGTTTAPTTALRLYLSFGHHHRAHHCPQIISFLRARVQESTWGVVAIMCDHLVPPLHLPSGTTTAPTTALALWSSNGTQAWNFTSPSLGTSLRCGSHVVFVASAPQGVLSALEAATGKLLWQYNYGFSSRLLSPVANEAAGPGGFISHMNTATGHNTLDTCMQLSCTTCTQLTCSPSARGSARLFTGMVLRHGAQA
jgi:hypothetical protein